MGVLIVEDDRGALEIFREALVKKGFKVKTAESARDALAKRCKVLVLDLGLPDVETGFKLMDDFVKMDNLVKIIVVTGHGDKGTAKEAIRRGAFDYFEKPVDLEKLALSVEKALYIRSFEEELKVGEETLEFEGMIGVSSAMQNVFESIKKFAPFDIHVLIEGASGTGKELCAEAIHNLSPRSKGPFIAINCGAIPDGLLESELFGYEKGAFTGASDRKPGKIELASDGTLVLDEISEMRKDLQVKLLRVVEEGVIWRVGGTRPIPVNTRFLFLSNKPLDKETREGKFREDLYFRISAYRIEIPPLKDREEDIILLARYFLMKASLSFGKRVFDLSDDALKFLKTYDFPGNVRELKNMVERAVVTVKRTMITKKELEEGAMKITHRRKKIRKLRDAIKSIERELIEKALRKHDFNIKKTSKELGISRPNLYFLMKKHRIK